MIYLPNDKDKPSKKSKVNLENSPDSEKFEKCLDDLTKYVRDGINNETEFQKLFMFFSDISKKTKYQTKIVDSSIILIKMKEFLCRPTSNPDITIECAKIILNLSKNRNSQIKMLSETVLSFNDLFYILLVNLNTNLTFYLLTTFACLTESSEILSIVQRVKKDALLKDVIIEEDDPNYQMNQIIMKMDLSSITRTLVEKILDDLSSNNKKIMLKIIHNMYSYDKNFIFKEAIEPIIRCLGNKNNDVVIMALKLLLFFTKDKSFHNDLIAANCIFRLVRTYKQGIDEMDMVIVKILYDLFENRTLYDLLFENNVLLILSNYLTNFEVEKNEKYEEVIRNVFEIFKLINKNTDDEIAKSSHNNITNPLVDDEALQVLIFKKAYSLAAFSKSEASIFSCLSVLQIMLMKFSSSLLSTNDSVKSIIELVPPFFKNKNLDIIKYSLSIFEIIIDKKITYFQETYAQSSNQTFSIKSLVHSIINLVNELSGNYELLSMSCRILVTLSDIPKLQPHFLQEPQITVLKVFNDNLLKSTKAYRNDLNNIQQRLNNNTSNTKSLALTISQNEKKDSMSGSVNNNSLSGITSGKLKLASNQAQTIKAFQIRSEEKDRHSLVSIEKKIGENVLLLKDSLTIISNLAKNVDNLEILTLKGFLDVITEKLNDNDTETLPFVVKCIQGFCQGQASIDIILKIQIISKILATYKLYKKEDSEQKNVIMEKNAKSTMWSATTNRLEVLQSLKNILESDIKLQRTFIIEKGIEILLSDVSGDAQTINEVMLDQLNEMILRVIYVVSCNINKLFLIYFSNEDDIMNNSDDDDNESEEESECNSEKEDTRKEKGEEILLGEDKDKEKEKEKENENKQNDPLPNSSINKIKSIGKTEKSQKEKDNNNNDDIKSNLSSSDSGVDEESESDSEEKKQKSSLLKIFTSQLSEKNFMQKLIEVGEFDINSLSTYKELTKILINLYLNRYYLKYFTLPRVFDKVINIIGNIMKKYKENVANENNYEILKLVIIFLKFICEDESLIKKFLKEDVISILITTVTQSEFSKNIKEEELEQFYYNFSLVLLRLTEFSGHVEKFKSFPDFFATLDKLYDINLMNGKIYIISIIRNIIAEKQDFFNEDDLAKFLNKIVSQSNTFVIYEFVELIKNLVHNRSMCKRMENVFKYLITEIKSNTYSSTFKKKMLDLILCLSYENANIRDYALHDLLSLVKNLDVNINQKTTLLILMNFSSISSNFSYLMQKNENDPKQDEGNNIDGMTIKKKDFINVINHLIDSDRFSQILIQRLLINITSIDGIDMSIISDKIMKVLIEILQKCKTLQENIVIFSLATLVNVSNRNILKFDRSYEIQTVNKKEKEELDGYEEQESGAVDTNQNDDKISVSPKKVRTKKETAFKPIEENKEIIIVDYILESLPNIIEVIDNLLEKNNLDISSLTIMFACNLLRKIKYSKYFGIEKSISETIEKYVLNEPKLTSDILSTNCGKFFIIAVIKYCICLSIENNDKSDISKYKTMIDIIMKVFKESSGIIRQFKITINDIKENTINFACVENQLNFFNMLIALAKQKDNKYYFTYNSYGDMRNYIGAFFITFINEYSELLAEITPSTTTGEDNPGTEGEKTPSIDLNPSFQNVLINILKLLTEYIAEIQILSEAKDTKVKAIRKKMNVVFYNKVSSAFEKIVLSLITQKPSSLNEELKSLLIYVLFLILSNNITLNMKDKEKDKNAKPKMNISDKLMNNIELEKWIMKIFMLNTNSIQNDFFCLKIFTISIHSEKYPDIFYQSTKFIKKLIGYLKYNDSDTKRQILQKESERILNIISFNPNSHSMLYSMGIYNLFKTNLFVKSATTNTSCNKEDFILLVNMILNKANKDFIQDDIKSLLQCIFPCKDLANNLRVELFDVFMSYTVEVPNEKKFHEDYLIIFNLLYENLKESFSEMIFLFDKFTKTYQNFAKKFLSEDSIVIKIFYDFLEYDKNFPSKAEELNCYLKILELFCEVGDISDKIEKMVNEMMFYFTKDEARNNLRDINILNAILNFSFLFFVKFCEKRSLNEVNIDNSIATSSNNDEGRTSNIISATKNKEGRNDEKIVEFVRKFYYNKLVDIVIDNSISNKEINSIYVLTMLIIQEDFKSMLLPLKTLNSVIFKRDFLMSFFKIFFNYNTLDIKEFVFVIHLAIILSGVATKLEFAEEFILLLIDIYDKHILKRITSTNHDIFNDIITSIYFFCDLIKLNDLSTQGFGKVLKFLIKIVNTYSMLTTEQKEILIRYYQEILLHYRINNNEDLIVHMTFFNKVHADKDLCFIENLLFGTLLINTRRDVLLKNLNDFFTAISMISLEEYEKKNIINFFKFCKQIFLCITNNSSGNTAGNSNIGEQAKQCLNALGNFINNSTMKYIAQIKEDPDLSKKYDKIKALLS